MKPKNEKAQQLKELATKTKDKAKALNAWVELSYLEQTRHSDEAITACENGYALARQLGDLPTAASLVLRKALVLGMSGLPWEAKTLLETAYSDQSCVLTCGRGTTTSCITTTSSSTTHTVCRHRFSTATPTS